MRKRFRELEKSVREINLMLSLPPGDGGFLQDIDLQCAIDNEYVSISYGWASLVSMREVVEKMASHLGMVITQKEEIPSRIKFKPQKPAQQKRRKK